MFSILAFTLLSFQLFNPTVRLSSGKQISLIGEGPPVIFSSGLFSTMPTGLYNDLINKLKKNVTIVSLDNFSPLSKRDINDIVDSLNVNSISYLSHSSFRPDILESDKINKAILVDPICLPKFDVESLNQVDLSPVNIDVKFPVIIFKAEKLYEGDKTLPEWQDPLINGVVSTEVINDVGHPDLLDDTWAEVAKGLGFWDTAKGEKVDFKEWKFVKNNNVKAIRKRYRDYVAERTLEFINLDYSDNTNTNTLVIKETMCDDEIV